MRFQQIYDWIEAHKPEVILETGTWNAQNAVRMLKEGGKSYIGFDLWEDGDEVLDEVENNAKKRVTFADAQKTLIEYTAELIKGNTRDTLPWYVKDKKPFVDMALIDGGHSKGTIKNDLLNILPLMKQTGVIFIDDYYFGCPTAGIGAQSLMGEIQLPYVVLPKADKAKGGYLVKIVQIHMRDVARPHSWDVPEEQAWKFVPGEAA